MLNLPEKCQKRKPIKPQLIYQDSPFEIDMMMKQNNECTFQ